MNKYRPHVLVLPEDDANRQIANGFLLWPSLKDQNIQILPSAGGWTAVRDKLHTLLPDISKYPDRIMVLLGISMGNRIAGNRSSPMFPTSFGYEFSCSESSACLKS